MASRRFFPAGQGLFHGPSPADLLVDFHKTLRQLAKAVKGLHLALRFAQFGRRSKRSPVTVFPSRLRVKRKLGPCPGWLG